MPSLNPCQVYLDPTKVLQGEEGPGSKIEAVKTEAAKETMEEINGYFPLYLLLPMLSQFHKAPLFIRPRYSLQTAPQQSTPDCPPVDILGRAKEPGTEEANDLALRIVR